MRKLIHVVFRRMIENRQRKGSMMKSVSLSPDDAAQVKAILMTHAEMQDRRTLEGEVVLSRLRLEEPDEVDMIELLIETGEELIEDSENLKRIAHLF